MQNWSSQDNNGNNNKDNNNNKHDDSTTKATTTTTDTTATSITSDRNDSQNIPPPPKRRKIDRPPSPPWKSAAHQGPTSFLVDGRRKSSRTNKLLFNPASPVKPAVIPIATPSATTPTASNPSSDVQNPSKRRHLSARPNPASPSATKSKSAKSAATTSSSRHTSDASSSSIVKSKSRSRSASTRGAAAASIPTSNRSTQLTKSRRSGTASGIDSDQSIPRQDAQDPTSVKKRPVPRIRLKVAKPSLGAFHPGNVLRPRKYSDFRDWFEHEGAVDPNHRPLSTEEALREARIRRRLLEAGQPGNVLSEQQCSLYLTDPIEEPPRQYFHRDHLIAHTLYFKKLLDKEHKQHRNIAKILAHACAEEWRRRNKRPEDLLRQEHDLLRQKRRQVHKDLQRLFDNVRAEVHRMRLEKWEAERKIQDQLALNKAIKQSTMLFEKRRPDRYKKKAQDGDTDRGTENEETEDGETISEGGGADEEGEGEETDASDDSGTERSDFMSSTSESESDTDGLVARDEDENLTAEQLKQKYAHLETTAASSSRVDPVSEPDDPSELNSSVKGKDKAEDSDQVQPPSSVVEMDGEDADARPSSNPTELENVDSMRSDESDEESTDMDDEDESDADESSVEEDSEEETGSDDDEQPGGLGLLGFFSEQDLEEMKRKAELEGEPSSVNEQGSDAVVPEPSTRDHSVTDDEIGDDDEVELVPAGLTIQSTRTATPIVSERGENDVLDGTENKIAPPTGNDKEPTPNEDSTLPDQPAIPASPVKEDGDDSAEPTNSADGHQMTAEKETADEPDDYDDIKTPIPKLLRGNLRKYQHYGLDWLAGLYNNNINGILADEMGLGKTIQTIALLAHLAIEHEVWGPHLVVVPTSVMLNWEMEFKKWAPGFKILTYYGSQEERRQKRRGWMDDDRWHVCITSYQLVLQDQQTFKRRNWHYMILDEAHNIKNFRSQRWQTLLTFKTRSRLLLTGTPLQNNLTELWSLLFFLMPSDDNDMGIEGFADLRNFSEWFRRPVEQILEHGRETMDDEAKQVVTKLHTVLRPYILRRLKIDVEKQMPAKYEHVVVCKLSKRQRFLYDGFMSRSQTKETLASGNYLSIINCLMQLRKVCNHPDLFETRPITTSFAMPKSAIADYEISELLVRRRLLAESPGEKLNLDFMNLVPISDERLSKILANNTKNIAAHEQLSKLREEQDRGTNWKLVFDGSSVRTALESTENNLRKTRVQELEQCIYLQSQRQGRQPVFGKGLIDMLTITPKSKSISTPPRNKCELLDWYSDKSSTVSSMIYSLEERALQLKPIIEKYAVITPSVVAPGITDLALTPIETRMLTHSMVFPAYDPLYEPQTRLTIAFPDKRLLQYDCGKLQQLEVLLRKLQAGGHRALIFTQMTKMLDILEQFLNIHGYLYLRLDGATKVEQRQILTDRFNSDPRILVFILSSRSGGLGINLTGADTVIFYDLDWNPAMDKQCQDRCHRIGQTRDVHIYRLVSEYTIESNILRKANQKRMLDDVVIQEGKFTTDYSQRLDVREMLDDLGEQDEASAAMDRVLDVKVGATRTFEQAEDKEDIDAAKNAEKEVEKADAGDFEEGSVTNVPGNTQSVGASRTGTPRPSSAVAKEGTKTETQLQNPASIGTGETTSPGTANGSQYDDRGHIDSYLLRFMEWNLKDVPLVLPPDKRKKLRRRHDHRRQR